MRNDTKIQAELRKVYLQAETDIINEISRLRTQGLIDYHAVSALKRVQEILKQMETDAARYIPKMIEEQFYAKHPKIYSGPAKTAEQHAAGYAKAAALNATQTEVVKALVDQAMADLNRASEVTMENLHKMIIGREGADIYRKAGIEAVTRLHATGAGIARNDFVEILRRDGVTSFTDKAGRKWNLHSYADMVCRTTSRQAEVLSVLTADDTQDLYQITKIGSNCPICSVYEGRVFSKSGKSKDFPPLADAFGKRKESGGNSLTNTYLNIHPNCRHALRPWTAAGRSAEEVDKIKKFSSPETNPYDRDPRSQQAIEQYHEQNAARARYLADKEQFERYLSSGAEGIPKTFETFEKHKGAGDDEYKKWMAAYRAANKQSQ